MYSIHSRKELTTTKQKMKHFPIKCPYCGRTAILRNASYVYKENAMDSYLYVCSGYPKCDSYVGVHANTMLPKGSLANGDLRHKRIEAHRLFDALWKNGIFSRKEAYRWMQNKFSLTSSQAHIGHFSDYRCECLMSECRKVLKNNHVKIA